VTHWDHTHPKARKPHRCHMCYRTIEPGERYRRTAGMDGSTAWTWIECDHCEAFARFAYRRSWSDDGYDESLFVDFAPETIAEARVRAQWRRKWRRLDGSLYPVPDLTITEDKYGFGWPTAIAPGGAAC
jgi:hypothetical protein